jgi:putative heme-binding domain-containing protein
MLLLPLFSLLAFGSPDTHVRHGLRLPSGFEVVEFAGSDLANDIYCLTVDPKGRIVVAGRGYIRILIDDNGDGKADRAVDFADTPKDGAMGLLWEGDTLYVTGDGGLRSFRDANGDDRADGPSELIRALKTGGEHHAHAILRGPDGWLYVLCGDGTGIDNRFATLSTSPVKDPIGGCVIRFTPDFKDSEIVAHGFRNPYAMDFNPDGELFTYDSDNERCVSLPWYEPTRFYHVLPGGHHGWMAPQRAQFWRRPPYFPDVVAPVATLGRGSPTACVCYRHTQFPRSYRGGFFLADWTFGRVYFHPTSRIAGGYGGASQVFLQAEGDNGFAPTAAAVHPQTGDLYLSTGGRGTRGAVYRIRQTAGFEALIPSRVAQWQPRKRNLGPPASKRELLDDLNTADRHLRLRALQGIDRHENLFSTEELLQLIRALSGECEPSMRQALCGLVARVGRRSPALLLQPEYVLTERLLVGMGSDSPVPHEILRNAAEVLVDRRQHPVFRLEAVRILQRAMGDIGHASRKGTVWEGYSAQVPLPEDLLQSVRRSFPTGNRELDREHTRILAMQGAPDTTVLPVIAKPLAVSNDPVEDVHTLAVLARLKPRANSAEAEPLLNTLLALDDKLSRHKHHRDRNWPLRVGEIFRQLNGDDDQWQELLVLHPDFGRAEHVLFCRHFRGRRQAQLERRAAESFTERATQDADFAWAPEHVRLIAKLQTEAAFELLRRQWSNGALRDAILLALPTRPEDRDKFLAGLESPTEEVMKRSLQALALLPKLESPSDLLQLLRAYRRLLDSKTPEAKSLREQFLRELQRSTGQGQLGDDPATWIAWFRRTYPELAARLEGPDNVDMPAWRKRLDKLDWSRGHTENGQRVYQRIGCASCHSGANALGPDLNGVALRFSRDDLFTARLQPSKDVSARYQTLLVATVKGQVYQGAVIYEATDSLILQTGANTTVRIPVETIATRRASPNSLMPAGLLDPLADQEIVDLHAYLRRLNHIRP